jgi:SAM-dependent methyltransferase
MVRAVPGLRRLYHWLGDQYSELVLPPPREGARALEFGCGAGRYLDLLCEAGWQAEGIEPVADPARRCRERGLHVQTGTFESVTFPDGSFDLIIAWMVVEHLHDPNLALQKIRKLLRTEGTFVFSVPNLACWETLAFGRFHFILNEPTHLHHFRPRTLRRLLSQNGFRVERLFHQQNVYNVLGSMGVWLHSRFPNRAWGSRILNFCDNPSMWGRLACAPAAKLLAALRQSGRLTIIARKDSARES